MDVCIPDVEDIYFYLLFASRIIIFMSPSFSSPTTVFDMHYLLSFYSASSPTFSFRLSKYWGTPCHLTNPPQTDLDALPDPSRANYDNSTSLRTFPKSPFKATARQASPEAEEAIPEAVGKELLETISK
jgi:hypothetical protein